jgi:hypothetical protein
MAALRDGTYGGDRLALVRLAPDWDLRLYWLWGRQSQAEVSGEGR